MSNNNNNVQTPDGWVLLKNGRSTRTGEVRLSYPRLFELDPTAEINKDQYTTSLIVSKAEVQFLVNVVVANTYHNAVSTFAKWGGKKPTNFSMPNFKELTPEEVTMFGLDGGKKWYSIVAKTKQKPTVIDLQTNRINDPSEIYSGVIARVSLSAFPWAFSGKQGVSFALGVVQKVAEGQRVGGSPANDMSLFADTSGVDTSMFGGDPFASATPQATTQPQPQSFAFGSNDGDLVLPQPAQQTPQQTNHSPFGEGDALPF